MQIWFRSGRYDDADVLAVIARGDENYKTKALADVNERPMLVIGVPHSNSERAKHYNSFLQRVRLTIAIVKYYYVNNNKLQEFRGEIHGLKRAVRKINQYDYPHAPRALIEAIASRFYSLVMNNLGDKRLPELERFNAILKKMTGYWIKEKTPGDADVYPPVWEPAYGG